MIHAEPDVSVEIKQPFSTLALQESLLKNLASLEFEIMTPIQMQSLPILLKREDLIAQANTGSGKTISFGLCILNHLKVENYTIQALVLCPTRELAEQVSQVLRRLARQMSNVKILNLSGGIPMRPQIDSLRHGAHIIVGTPGRIQAHLDKETLSLRNLQTLVLDEADRMLDMGFFDDIKAIVADCPSDRQTLLFSATYPNEIKKLSKQFMNHPHEISITATNPQYDIQQLFYQTNNQAKYSLLKDLLLHHQPLSTLIFCNTKQNTADIAAKLQANGFSALALHGDMEQTERDQVLIRFVNQSCSILVATDVAARGLDINELPAVINYDMPFESHVYIHRIGRTGRAGHKGLALNLTTAADAEKLAAIEETLMQPLVWDSKNEFTQCDPSALLPKMITLCIDVGRKNKIRPGDILGALTKDAGLPAEAIGKINIAAFTSYIAINHKQASKAYNYLQNGKLKGRKVNVRKLL